MENDNSTNMAKAQQPKKKKIIIFAIVILFLILCSVACLFIFMPSSTDQAFSNFSDTIKSVIDPSANTNIKNKNIVAEVSLSTKKSDGSSSPALKAMILGNNEKTYIEITTPENLSEGKDPTFKLTTTKIGELFLRLDGFNDAIKNNPELSALNLGDGIELFNSLSNEISDKWLYFSAPEIEAAFVEGEENAITCLTNEYKTRGIIGKAGEIYSTNQFFTYEEYKGSNVTPKESGKIYEVKVNSDKLLTFTKSLTKTASDKIRGCLGVSEDEGKILEAPESISVEDLPKIYVEIVDTDIVRAEIFSADEKAELDINFSYPETIDIPTPEKEKSIIDLINQIFTRTNN